MKRLAIAILATSTALLAACGGGGGGTPGTKASSAPTSTPTSGATPVPSATPTSGANTTSLNILSVPAGLGVTIVNGGTQTLQATTPTSDVPPASDKVTTVTITPSNGAAAFVYASDQRSNGSHTVLYNQSADTNGSIASISSASRARRTAAQSLAAAGAPRFFSRGARGRPAWSQTRLVVRYRSAALQAASRGAVELERSVGISRGVNVGFEREGLVTRVVDVAAGDSIAALAARLRARAEVADVQPERLYYKESTTAVSPNDTHFNDYEQWALFDIKAPNAWGYTQGNPATAIAVIDTGADFNHADLAGAKITYAESVLDGVVTAGNAAAQDTDGHGTNVAGIAAANTNNGFGFAGVGFNTSLQIYKVFSNGTAANQYATTANSSDVTKAIYDAVAHGARVINLSLGTCQSQGVDTTQRDAVTYALARNVVVVAAAGNERGSGASTDATCANNSTTIDFPGAYDGVIAVGATTLDDSVAPGVFATATEHVASYSNSGPGLSLVAPGGDPSAAEAAPTATSIDPLHWIYGIYTTTAADPMQKCSNPSDCRAFFAGTSQATPHVAGAAGLMLGLNANLSASQVKSILTSTAADIGDANQGSGRLDLYRALAVVAGDPNPPALPTNLNFVAFAYAPNGGTTPAIVDVTYTAGVPVASDGTFRIADIPANAPAYKIGVWSDTNGDGRIDAGDSFGTSQLCSAAAACASATGILVHPVSAGFTLN